MQHNHDDPLYGPIDPYKPRRANPGALAWAARKGTRTINPRHPSFEVKVTAAQARGLTCDVEGCYRFREDFGHLCTSHRTWQRHHGDPTAGHLPRKRLGNWIVLGSRLIRQIDDLEDGHPARGHLALARHWWQVQVAQAEGYAGVSWRPHQSHEARWKRYVAAITAHGFNTDRVLALAITFYLAREIIPNSCAASDDHERHQLARLVLQSVNVKRPVWQGGAAEVPGYRFMQWAGERLRKGIGLFCGHAAQALRGDPWGGYPSLEDQRPVPKTTATKAARRPRYRPPNDYVDDDDDT
jgi:hypothetical protein